LKFLIDFLPAIAFFIGFKTGDIYFATKLGIGASVLAVLYLKLTGQKITPILWLSLVVITVFGGLTIALHDETFIKWKPTVLYTLSALALLIGHYGFKRNLLKWLLNAQLHLPVPIWTRLMQMWAGFFLLIAAVNAWVATNFDTETWVSFRTFGITGALFVFAIGVAVYLARHLQEPPSEGASAESDTGKS
jgi:intracellular septation protein